MIENNENKLCLVCTVPDEEQFHKAASLRIKDDIKVTLNYADSLSDTGYRIGSDQNPSQDMDGQITAHFNDFYLYLNLSFLLQCVSRHRAPGTGLL